MTGWDTPYPHAFEWDYFPGPARVAEALKRAVEGCAMGRFIFKLPDVGEGTAEAEIVAWHVTVGDTVEEDAPLVDVMTDKATVEMTSPVAGRVVALIGELGEMAAVGSMLVELDIDGADAEAAGRSGAWLRRRASATPIRAILRRPPRWSNARPQHAARARRLSRRRRRQLRPKLAAVARRAGPTPPILHPHRRAPPRLPRRAPPRRRAGCEARLRARLRARRSDRTRRPGRLPSARARRPAAPTSATPRAMASTR